MLRKNPGTSQYKPADAARNLLCLTILLSVVSVGCKSNRTSAESPQTLTPEPEQLYSAGEAADVSAQLYTANASIAGVSDRVSGVPSPVSSGAVAGARLTGYNSAVVPPAIGGGLGSTEAQRATAEVSAGSGTSSSTAESVSGVMTVNAPALNEPGMADELISLNFDKVDIHAVLKTIGDITGINFVVDKSVAGPITVMSPTKIRLGDLYGTLESILDVQGYAAVPAGDLVKIVPKADAAKRSLNVRIGSDAEQIPSVDTIVTQIMPLKYADAEEVSRIIQPFLAGDSQMSTYARTNSIVVTDTSSNIRRLARIIEKFDVAGSKEDTSVFPLKFASAQVLSEQINRIMAGESVLSSSAGRNRADAQAQAGLRILPDERTNSLIVVANPQDTQTIRELVEKLDVERSIGSNNVQVMYLQNADAKETAQSLTAALANLKVSGAIEAAQPVQVTADESTNALIIACSPQDFEVISQIIEKLDIVREQVLVEMLIVEVTEDSVKEIGVDWATLDQSVDGSVRGFGLTNFGPRSVVASGTLEGLAVGMYKGAGTNRSIGSVLYVLNKMTGVNILSTPHILTSNHNQAKIVVGENIPYVVESRITETSDFLTPTVIDTFDYKDVGITLDITPHISQGGLVRLDVNTTFTKLIEGTTGASANTPTTAKREAQTVVSMESGSTVVIGGLIRDDKTIIQKKVPLLGDVPVLGNLFKYRKDSLQKTNLLLFITPYRLGSQTDLNDITQKKRDETEPAIEDFKRRNEKK
ncbi:MAG: type II secretion system secretin GspD [Sedimentisphaerales bacterium]|nr:type II secretion system secretin GspD [Sedimentisphaerales bacterium]